MGSLSGLFGISRGALEANQAALNTTASNVANQGTPGYTRQVANFSAGDSVTLSGYGNGPGGQSSSGPQVTASSARDRVLEVRVQQQMQSQSEASARAGISNQTQAVFSITSSGTSAGSTQIGTALDGLFRSLTALAGNPADGATRQGVLSAARTLAGAFRSAATQLRAVSRSIDEDVANSVATVNQLTTTIAELNKQIGEVSPNTDAGTLEDKRQLAIEKMSQLVGVDQIKTENNGVTLTTTGGAVLVEGRTAHALSAVVSSGQSQLVDSVGNDVTAGIHGGSIGGELQAQQVDVPGVLGALDALAHRVATAVNAQNAAGVTASGAAGGSIFGVSATVAGAAASLTVVVSGAGDIASAAVGEGILGDGNANALANVEQALDSKGLTVGGQLSGMVAMVGSNAAGLQDESTVQQATLTQLTTQRDSESGVSLDMEAANLSQYQRSYQAAAELMLVLNKLMATAMNLGTPTAVS